MGTTATLGLPYPELNNPADVPADVKKLADKLDTLAPGYVPVGALMMWPTAAAPVNWLLCQGQQVDAALYPALAGVIGAAGGLITLPALAQRFPIGAGGAYALNGQGGADVVTLTAAQIPAHKHAITDPGHGHTDTLAVANAAALTTGAAGSHNHFTSSASRNLPQSTAGWNEVGFGSGGFRGAGTSGSADITDALMTSTAAAHSHTVPVHGHALTGGVDGSSTGITGTQDNADGGGSHSNIPPFFVVNFIIRAK